MGLIDLLPDRPGFTDKELDAWLIQNGGRGREALTYRKVKIRNPLTGQLEPFARCTCSVCNAEWLANVFGFRGSYPEFENLGYIRYNGDKTMCPECGAEVEAAYYSRLKRHPIVSTMYPWEIVKRDGNIMFICWAVMHEIDECGSYIYPEKRNAYVLDTDGKWHRFTATGRSGWSSMSKMVYLGKWYSTDRFTMADGNFRYRLPNAPDVYEGTQLENAKIEKLEEVDPSADLLMYARIYMRHRNIENITMNTPHLMAKMLREIWGTSGLDWLNWSAVKPHEMLYMEKAEYKASDNLSKRTVSKMLQQKRKEGACVIWGIPRDYAETLGETGATFAFKHKNDRVLRRFGLVSIWNYILKQDAVVDKKNAWRPTLPETVKLCEDYWRDIKKAKFDVKNRTVVFPKNLGQAHARAITAIQYAENEKLKEKFEKVAKRLQPLAWEHDGLTIVPAQSESQLIAEGKVLGHCVGGYGDQHCDGNSIFFIRKAETPDVPFYTLQLDTKTGRVIQNRGEKNCARTDKVAYFEKLWLQLVVEPWIAEDRKKKKKEQKNAA